jgi:hypothetical protein
VKTPVCTVVFVSIIAPLLCAAEDETTSGTRSVSPDKQWEYRVSDESAKVVKAGTDEAAVDLGEEIGWLAAKTGSVVWAPDSRRFAFNTRKGGKYYGCELYELTGTTWKKLPELESTDAVRQTFKRCLAQQLKRVGAKKNASLNMVMSQWRLRRWLDNDTFEAYVSDERRVMLHPKDEDWEYLGCAVLFTMKCDNRGGWKVLTSRVLSDEEDEKLKESDD